MEARTLVTFLGKVREDPATGGYREATYEFPDGTKKTTSLFGVALADYLDADTLVILGTSASQWGVVLQKLVESGCAEDSILQLWEAENDAQVSQPMLDDVADLMTSAVGRRVLPHLIPFGKEAEEQYRILKVVATVVDSVPNDRVSFDVTHGFRHLGMVGLQAAFMLRRIRDLQVESLWYGALDMTEGGITPVLKLDGLMLVQRWTAALERFDATGDYGVFAPLLAEDDVEPDKTEHLRQAAFHERNFNLKAAADNLRKFLPVLKEDLSGASGLFRDKLSERLDWVNQPTRVYQQRKLAFQYLQRGDFVRAAVLVLETYITDECWKRDRNPDDFHSPQGRKGMEDDIHNDCIAGSYPFWKWDTYQKLKKIRNALAHPASSSGPEVQRLLTDERQLEREIKQAIQQLVP